MKHLIKILLFGIIIPLMICCSKPLSRENAESAIIQKEKLPFNETQDFQFTQNEDISYVIPFHYMAIGIDAYVDEKNNFTKRIIAAKNAKLSNPAKLPIFEVLEKAEMITYSIDVLNISVNTTDVDLSSPGNLGAKGNYKYGGTFGDFKCIRTIAHRATLTEKGKKYITNNNKVILATYEFGEITGIVEEKESNTAEVNYTVKRTNITPFGQLAFNMNEETYNRTANFTKYDDGWRINQ